MKPSFVFALASFVAATIAFAESPLDAPGEKKVTVATEISRGAQEIAAAGLKDESLNLATLNERMSAVLSRNNAANTDSEGFLLGAGFLRWYLLDVFLKHPFVQQNNTAEELRSAETRARAYFADMRRIQKALNVDDDGLLKAVGLKTSEQELKSLLAAYDAGREPD